MLDITRYNKQIDGIKPKKILFISDTHSTIFYELDSIIYEEKPDFIALTGDIVDNVEEKDNWDDFLFWLKQINQKVPIIASLGNHDVKAGVDILIPRLKDAGITVLDNSFVQIDDIYLYGYTPELTDSLKFPNNFPEERKKTILMCHRPEDFYETVLLDKRFPLTLSGHCHGGQWRLFNRGFYAPGQGFFPEFTSGFYFDDKLLISRGMGNKTWAPRINNKPEAILLQIN